MIHQRRLSGIPLLRRLPLELDKGPRFLVINRAHSSEEWRFSGGPQNLGLSSSINVDEIVKAGLSTNECTSDGKPRKLPTSASRTWCVAISDPSIVATFTNQTPKQRWRHATPRGIPPQHCTPRLIIRQPAPYRLSPFATPCKYPSKKLLSVGVRGLLGFGD